VLFGQRKVAGILTEMNAEPTGVRHIVVGIGVNVNNTQFSFELQPIATSLHMQSGCDWSRVHVTAALLKSLDSAYRKLTASVAGARVPILREFERRSSYTRGRHVRVGDNDGYVGVTEGLDERGFLRVRTDDGLHTVLSGKVRALSDQ
jgi:BirA family biotin operon repressor/biotin-[acetyl-CoA-carboxylase] ligase